MKSKTAVHHCDAKRWVGNFFELSAHYNLPHFWADCKRKAGNFRYFFSESIEHFFNNLLVIPCWVCYNGLCKQSMTLQARA